MQSTFAVIIILSVVRLWIGGQLLATGRKYNLKNLYWLAAWSFIVAVYVIFAPTTPPTAFSVPVVYYFGTLIGQFFLVMFMHKTFYQEKRSPVGFFIAIIVAASLAVSYLVWTGAYESAGLVSQGVTLINWAWHFLLAWQAYRLIRDEASVENWVKGRYRLMVAFSLVIFIGNLVIMPLSTSLAKQLPAYATHIGAGINLLGTIILFLAWVMPEPLRLWLNRNQASATTSEETIDARAIMGVISDAIMAKSHINQTACLYVMRQTVSKIIANTDATAVDQHIAHMTYEDWQQFIRSDELRDTLSNFLSLNTIEPALNNARAALIEKQSLFTLAAK